MAMKWLWTLGKQLPSDSPPLFDSASTAAMASASKKTFPSAIKLLHTRMTAKSSVSTSSCPFLLSSSRKADQIKT
jgi:hypothetical protein